jgi:hypothetical protein
VHLATKDQLHLLGTAQIDVFADDLLEEAASVEAPIPNLSEGELGLEDGQVIAVTGAAVSGAVGVRQASQPFAEEGVDLGGGQTVSQALGGGQIRTTEQAVVQRFEGDAPLGELALQVFVAVETQFGRIGKVGAELEEEGSEVPIAAVEVVNVDHGGGVHDPRHRASAGSGFARGARHADFFLGDADEDHSLVGLEAAQLLLEDVVLALALLEADQLQALLLDERLDGFDEGLGHRNGLFGGGEAMA